MKKTNRIISKVKSKYWTHTHKCGVKLPNSVTKSMVLEKYNSKTLWWEEIVKEMKNVRIALELYERNVEYFSHKYQEVSFHITFDVKMGENFRHKF